MSDIKAFEPTKPQLLAKVRFERRMAERQGLIDVGALKIEEIAAMAGDRRVARWLDDPEFGAWFTNRDDFVERANAAKQAFLDRITEALDMEIGDGRDGTITYKDLLAAADKVWKLAGAYPKEAPVRFADKDLDAMPDDEVQRQLAEARKRLPGST